MRELFPIDLYLSMETAINAQLTSYLNVSKDKWFRELCFCILTPQSSPFNAELSLIELEREGFFENKLCETEVSEILRAAPSYVRFHHQKAKRLSLILTKRFVIEELLSSGLIPDAERDLLIESVTGFGLKEASHALRNIGRRGLGILDRHILRALNNWGAIDCIPKTLTYKSYKECEHSMNMFAIRNGITIDQMDLFMWGMATHLIFK